MSAEADRAVADLDPPDQEANLWRAFKAEGSLAAREALITSYLPFARQIARRQHLDTTSGDIEFADLCQLAYAGLLEAADHFDPDAGAQFKSYAAHRILGSILDGLSQMSEVREQISFRNRMRRERLRSLTEEDVANLSADQALQALTGLAVGLAIGFMLEGTGLYRTDEPHAGYASAYDSLAWKETVQKISEEVSNLPERERYIIRRHYLDGLNFDQIGTLLSLSKGRVSQLHKSAIQLLRRRLPRRGDFHLLR